MPEYRVGGIVGGLDGTGLVLQDNGTVKMKDATGAPVEFVDFRRLP